MNRRQRLMTTLRGGAVDRPPVCFYEINGLDEDPTSDDPFNIYSHPSWLPLIELARDSTDRIVMRSAPFRHHALDPLAEMTHTETWHDGASRFTRQTVRLGGRTLSSVSRRDRDVNTVWVLEPLLKGADDLEALLTLPPPAPGREPDIATIVETETILGDSGIVMIDTPDPLCLAASLFDMGTFTVIALTQQALFHRLIERFAAIVWPQTEAIAAALPGRLWRIYGPEYASPPYLPPRLFEEYVVQYDTPMVNVIQRLGGFARIHSHGRLRAILDLIASTGCIGLDPIEPPPQGDVSLRYVRERYGAQIVLFGNLEASDIENLPGDLFAAKVRQAVDEGTAGSGRGFVLMPSACPYGRVLSPLAMENYRTMIDIVDRL
ncbi:MAG: hypothetical protein GX620_06555 [Chloroflexi bacterium]|nr:hypothetical protein [Chloroflexota bacterium]